MALALLTRLPVLVPEPLASGAGARSVWAYPLAGLILGGVAALGLLLARGLGIPPEPAAVVAVGLAVWLSGSLHEDGLADCADGFGGGQQRADKLAIMRDSRLGSYGAVALALSLLLRCVSLGTFEAPLVAAAILLGAETSARAVPGLVLRLVPPARKEGLAVAVGRPPLWALALGGGVGGGCGLGALAWGTEAGGGSLAAAALAIGLGGAAPAWLAWRQIGGQSGDVLGACQQGALVAFLLAATALAA